MTDTELKEETDKANEQFDAEAVKIKVVETSATGWIKTHYAVIGAIVCFVVGFLAGYMV
jgi:hypothetical protein